MNLLTLPLVNPRHHIGKLNGFAYLLFEAFMRSYVDAYMKLLDPLCLIRICNMNRQRVYKNNYIQVSTCFAHLTRFIVVFKVEINILNWLIELLLNKPATTFKRSLIVYHSNMYNKMFRFCPIGRQFIIYPVCDQLARCRWLTYGRNALITL